jgi:hypothetical protein
MNKKLLFLSFIFTFLFTPILASAASWKSVTPDGYTSITWAKAPGIASFFKAPSGSGSLDFLTRINLSQNQIQFIASSSTAPLDWGMPSSNFTTSVIVKESTPSMTGVATDTPLITPKTVTNNNAVDNNGFHNFAFARFVAESGKSVNSDAKFIWNAPFFNINLPTSDLSLALKTTVGGNPFISSGSRPDFDMANARKMLLINNRTGKANIQDFDADIFVGTTSGDQGLEGFAPNVAKSDGGNGRTARLFIGVMPNKQEVVIYCSQYATVAEASNALGMAGVPVENQMEADGGGSASCGYNLPGQYFVEPNRTLPLMMGAMTIITRGTPTTDGLNVRTGPAAKYAVVRKLNKTESVRVFAEKNGWYRIGVGEWVLKSLIKKQ